MHLPKRLLAVTQCQVLVSFSLAGRGQAWYPLVMRSVLVIDDVRSFRFDCAYARTVAQAVSLLEDPWDEVWFDHDLGRGETVRPAVLWIEEQIAYGKRPEIAQVVIHSSNPSGIQWIYQALRQHYPTRVVSADQLRAYLEYDD
jgi:hypothetical protein